MRAVVKDRWGDVVSPAPFAQLAEDFQRGYNRDKANRFYTMLTAAASGTVDTSLTGTTAIEKNIGRLNDSADAMLEALKNTRNLGDDTEILLYYPPAFKQFVLRALGELSQAFSGSTQRIFYNIRPIATRNDNMPTAATNDFACMMVVPGLKNQWAQIMAPTFFSETDILSLSFVLIKGTSNG